MPALPHLVLKRSLLSRLVLKLARGIQARIVPARNLELCRSRSTWSGVRVVGKVAVGAGAVGTVAAKGHWGAKRVLAGLGKSVGGKRVGNVLFEGTCGILAVGEEAAFNLRVINLGNWSRSRRWMRARALKRKSLALQRPPKAT